MNEEKTKHECDCPNGWIQMWQTIGWIVFFVLCFAYCCRSEIVTVMK